MGLLLLRTLSDGICTLLVFAPLDMALFDNQLNIEECGTYDDNNVSKQDESDFQ